MKEGYLDFDEYIVASEPHKRERAEAWKVAIGLQAVDGLKVSEYLKQTARRHIEGEITIDDYAILSANVLMHQFCRVGSYTMVGGGTRFSQNVLPFSLVAREPASFCGLNTIGLRRRGFDRDLINNIHMAYQIILQGTGKLNDLLARVEQEIPMSPEIDYILDFIRNSDRGFIR